MEKKNHRTPLYTPSKEEARKLSKVFVTNMPKEPQTKEKVVKAWAILLSYEDDPPYVFGISTDRRDVIEQYTESNLYRPEYRIVPVTITFKIPKS